MTNKVIELATHRAATRPLLQRFERSLPAGNAAEQINAILARPDYEGFIQSLNPQTLFRLIKEAGWNEGHDLVAYAAPWQIQAFVDLDCWQRDQFSVKKMEPWLVALADNADDAQFKRVMRGLEPEVIALYFKAHLHAEPYDPDEGIPDHLEGDVALSPDNAYVLVFPEDEDTTALLRSLINRLYESDYALAWTLFEATRWELTSEMEESAYRWRTSRMEELGFVKFEEALAVYNYVNPVQFRERLERRDITPKVHVRAPREIEVPVVIESHVDEDFYFFQILKEIESDTTVHDLLFELGTLINKTMIGDGIEPGELESGHEVARRTLGYLSLGLEFLSRRDDTRSHEVLQAVALRDVFRVGYSLTRKLQLNVLGLESRPTLSLISGIRFSLLNTDEEALCDAITRARPSYAENHAEFDLFRTQAQLDSAAQRVAMIAFKQLWLFGVLRQSMDNLAALVYGGALLNEPVDVTFDALFATAMATYLTGGSTQLRGLALDELQALPAILQARAWQDDVIAYFEALVGPILVELPPSVANMATLWLKATVARLEDELANVDFVSTPEFFQSVLLLNHPAAH
ncbi:MAG: hypothetical protein H0U74_10985 [Bradymonadaceae bacterium]|nr:hypothetical protein [Lujinxingiaceae bacterium]